MCSRVSHVLKLAVLDCLLRSCSLRSNARGGRQSNPSRRAASTALISCSRSGATLMHYSDPSLLWRVAVGHCCAHCSSPPHFSLLSCASCSSLALTSDDLIIQLGSLHALLLCAGSEHLL